MNLLKKKTVYGIIFLILQVLPYTFIQVQAETHSKIDEKLLENFRTHQPDYLAMSTLVNRSEVHSTELSSEIVQSFSFLHKTFRTTVNQPVVLRFKSKFEANQVLVRIPSNGQILLSHFSNGEILSHSHGEYWVLQTQKSQTEFDLPVVFDSSGNYFITIDHDADSFYLEVTETDSNSELECRNSSEIDELAIIDENQFCEKDEERSTQLIYAIEQELNISPEALDLEEARILEETRDSQNRSTSNVRNWSQFRTAWNSQSTTVINMTADITAGSNLLNIRSQSIKIQKSRFILNLGTSLQNILTVTGTANLELAGLNTNNTYSSLHAAGSRPVIQQSGSGRVSLTQGTSVNGTVIAQNISFQSGGQIRGIGTAGLEVSRGGTLEISNANNFLTGINNANIRIPGDATAKISGSRIRIHRNYWDSGELHLNGHQAQNVVSAITNPNDFEQLYDNAGLVGSNTFVIVNGFSGVAPPRPSYSLSLQASPPQGGNPTAEISTMQQGATTTINANPNQGYSFSRWEIVSGTGSVLSDATSLSTSFTMGNQNAVIRAVYDEVKAGEVHVYHTDSNGYELAEPELLSGTIGESYQTTPKDILGYRLIEKPENASGEFTRETIQVTYVYQQTSVAPVDPLDPETEVDPENKPELPEDQGLLSIDFASSFNFGSQVISSHDQNYYAKPQLLLNEDGTINESEERPNYIQISDRRSESDRNGWQLSVRQHEQFKNPNNQELTGASLRLSNQHLTTAQGGDAPSLQALNPLILVPGVTRTLIRAEDNEGAGTWVYRFGDANTAHESVTLQVPKDSNPTAQTYQTSLIWELSAVPEND